MRKTEESLSDLWDTMKYTNIHVTDVSGEKGAEFSWRIIAKNFSNLGKEKYIQIKEPKEIHIKTYYNQIVRGEKEFWKQQEKSHSLCTRVSPPHPIGLLADFSIETLQATREWDDILKVLAERKKMPTEKTITGKIFFEN